MFGRSLIATAATLVVAVALSACGADNETAVPADPQAAAGQTLVEASCTGCHSSNGERRTGPSFKGLAGSQVTLTGGEVVTADDAYLTRAILDPDAQTHDGYARGVMARSVRAGSVSEEEAAQMVAYIKTIK